MREQIEDAEGAEREGGGREEEGRLNKGSNLRV